MSQRSEPNPYRCSAYPVAGGQYSWVAVMAPRPVARGFSYVAGWFMLIGILAMGATNNFIVANFILGLANLCNPSYVIERWHTTLVAYCVGLAALAFNAWLPRLLDKVSKGIFIFDISSFVIVIVAILALNDHKQSASFVFSDFVNLTGYNASYTAVLGLLQSAFGMCCKCPLVLDCNRALTMCVHRL
jgi:choline transport protein